jgi:hypothetical protein
MSEKKKIAKWEYEFRSVHGLQHATNFANALGEDGWEMVGIVVRRIDKEKGMFTVAFKRLATGPRKPRAWSAPDDEPAPPAH